MSVTLIILQPRSVPFLLDNDFYIHCFWKVGVFWIIVEFYSFFHAQL